MAQRGRPVKYKGNQLKHIVALVRQHNALNAQRILNANEKSRSKVERELAGQRNLNLVPKALGISLPTLNKFAKAAGASHSVGRPAKAA